MSTKDCVDKPAKVIAVDSKEISVEMEVSEACGSCAAKAICGSDQVQKRIIKIKKPYSQKFTLGDRVFVSIKKRAGYSAVFLSYVLPFLIFFITLLCTTCLNMNELLVGLLSLASIIVYFGILILFRKKIEHKITFTITKFR